MAFDVEIRDVAEQRVLTRAQSVTQKQVASFVRKAIGEGWQAAPAFGGVIGPVFVVYEDDFTDGTSSPVEVCHPVAIDQDIPADVANCIEPAHREAFVRLPKSMLKPSRIAHGFAIVEQWIAANGNTKSAAPREVYFTNVMTAGPDDVVFDIAFPITD